MQGKYTVNEVEERTKVPASTLRQWERRYGFPMPARSESGYRLYSDRDLGQIEAMKRYIADGVPASRAAELVKRGGVPRPVTNSATGLLEQLVDALADLDEARADKVLSEAYALHPVETVMLELVKGAVLELGQRSHQGEAPVTTGHFANTYLRGRLWSLFHTSANVNVLSAPTVVVACAPGDRHELGALMLAVTLRRGGYRVYFLGADTPVAGLAELARTLRPAAVLVSVAMPEYLEPLQAGRSYFDKMAPVVAFGGAAVDNQPEVVRSLGGQYLTNDLTQVVERLNALLEQVNAK